MKIYLTELEQLSKDLIKEGFAIINKLSRIINSCAHDEDPLELLLWTYNFYKKFPIRMENTSQVPPVIANQQILESKRKILEV